MAFVLVRIDDRLVHGQVSVAWGSHLKPDRIVLVNDDVACCDWKRRLYGPRDSLGAEIVVLSIEQFLSGLPEQVKPKGRDFLIVGSPSDLVALVEGGLRVERANVGGLHYRDGKRQVLPYVFVDDDDVAALRELDRRGVRLEARDVPQAPAVNLARALDRLDEGGRAG